MLFVTPEVGESESNSRFNVRVRKAVCVHGSEVCAADDAHHQATLLRAVLQRDHDAPTFLQGLIVCLINLKEQGMRVRAEITVARCVFAR